MGWGYYGYGYGFGPYVSVADRLKKARKHATKAAEKAGRTCSPVEIEGRKFAQTFWGAGWCDHLESYSDISNRLERGRRYVRNGSVVDLWIEPGKVHAIVAGSDVYKIEIEIKSLAKPRWEAIKSKCAGQIGSMVELLQGKLSKGVMEIIANRDQGLFPAPKEIDMDCSCPDGARMCKHLAAVLYGIGARFDHSPELLFTLRGVDHLDLIAQVDHAPAITPGKPKRKTLATTDLSDVFGIELGGNEPPPVAPLPSPEQVLPSTQVPKTRARKPKSNAAPPGKTEKAPRSETPTSKTARVKKLL